MNDPLEQLAQAAARFARTTAAPPGTEATPDQHAGSRCERVNEPESDEADEKAAALAGKLTGRLGDLPVRSVASLIRIFSQRPVKIGAKERRLIASALDYGVPWRLDSIVALASEVGVAVRPGTASAMWEYVRPSRTTATDATQIQMLEAVMPGGRARTVQSLLDGVRSERLLMSAYRTFQCALKLGAKPSYTAEAVLDQVAREMRTGRLEPYVVKQTLARLGHKTDDLTVFEAAVYGRAARDAEATLVNEREELDVPRILEFLGGRRISAGNIQRAVLDAYGFTLTRERARELSVSLREAREHYAALSPATYALLLKMEARMPGLAGQDIVHRALLGSMQAMVQAGTPGFHASLGDARYARMITSSFTAMPPAAPVVAPVIRTRSVPKTKAPTS